MGFSYRCNLYFADGNDVQSRIYYMDGEVVDRIQFSYVRDATVTLGGVDVVPGINPILRYDCHLTRTEHGFLDGGIIYVYEYREEVKDCREAGHDVVDGKIYDFCKTCRRRLNTASRKIEPTNGHTPTEVIFDEYDGMATHTSNAAPSPSTALEELRERIREEERMGLSPQQIMVSRQQYDRLLAESELYNSTNTGLSFHGIDIIPEQPVEFRREYQVEWVGEPGYYRPNRYGYSAPLKPSNGTVVSVSTPESPETWTWYDEFKANTRGLWDTITYNIGSNDDTSND